MFSISTLRSSLPELLLIWPYCDPQSQIKECVFVPCKLLHCLRLIQAEEPPKQPVELLLPVHLLDLSLIPSPHNPWWSSSFPQQNRAGTLYWMLCKEIHKRWFCHEKISVKSNQWLLSIFPQESRPASSHQLLLWLKYKKWNTFF